MTSLPTHLTPPHPTVLLTSYGTTYLFHLLLRKYVFRIYKGMSCASDDIRDTDNLLIEKKGFWGLRRVVSVPIGDLVSGPSVLNTWRSRETGEGFLVQFVPPEPVKDGQSVSLGNITTFQGERVDLKTMERIFSRIATRQ